MTKIIDTMQTLCCNSQQLLYLYTPTPSSRAAFAEVRVWDVPDHACSFQGNTPPPTPTIVFTETWSRTEA